MSYRNALQLTEVHGLDYASVFGRFNTPDRFLNNSGQGDPAGWNRYAYVTGDPINLYDPIGTCGEPAQYGSSGGTISVNVYIPYGASGNPASPSGGLAYGKEGTKYEDDRSYGKHESPTSGGCSTPDGRPCYQVDIERRECAQSGGVYDGRNCRFTVTKPQDALFLSFGGFGLWGIGGGIVNFESA
jgi:RHS repeat-associated protein